MPNNENKTVKYKHSQKSKKAPLVIYSNQQSRSIIMFLVDIHCLLIVHLIILKIN